MASQGTPNEGLDNIIATRVYVSASLFAYCYVNTQDSLGQTSVFADLTQPSGTGYVPIPLNGTWSSTNGVVTYDHGTPDDPFFQNTEAEGGSNWSQAVTGIAISDGNFILHFKDTSSPVTMGPQKKLRVDLSNLVAP